MSELSSQSMPRRLPTGCIEDRDRHGNVRIYYRAKGGPKVRLRGTPWTPEFMAEYEGAKGEAPAAKAKGITPGTWRWLCTRYFAECAERVRRGIIEATFDEPIAPGSPRFFRDIPISRMTANEIEVLRDRKLAVPEGANNRVKAIRAVFKWAVRKKGTDGKPLASHNFARDVPYLKGNNPTGYHTWTLDEVRRASTHGNVRVAHAQDGRAIHARGGPTTARRSRNAHARSARTNKNRIVSHRGARWDFFGKNRSEIKGRFRRWCPGEDSNLHASRR